MKTRFSVFAVIFCLIAFTLNISASDNTADSETCEHQFGDVTFDWSEVTFSCQASGICRICDITERNDCVITKSELPPDSSSPGGTLYTATVTLGNETFTSTYTVLGLAHMHAYGTPEIRWSEDYTSAEAVAVCSLCSNNEPGKTVSASCSIDILTEAARPKNGHASQTDARLYISTIYLEQGRMRCFL